MGLLTCRDKCNVSDWLVLVGPVLTVVVFEISLALTRQSGLRASLTLKLFKGF